ncbi:MAG TPA: hypothetical protein VK626_01025 [Nitrospiraceae bacterium]|nr:hypothetical protein [Nitrospiraceae bacterium]
MAQEILAYPTKPEAIKEELRYLANYLGAHNHKTCEVLFGFAWGIEYYPDKDWTYLEFQIEKLVEEVEQVETLGRDRLGDHDLFIRLPKTGLEFLFCHHCDIHLTFEERNEIADFFNQRWDSLGFNPEERLKPDNTTPNP